MNDCLTLLAVDLAAAEAELLTRTGGSALCRPAGQRDEIKAAEGRVVALREVRRLLRHGGGTDDLHRALSSWEQLAGSGADWQSYRAGGVAALRALIARCDGCPDTAGL